MDFEPTAAINRSPKFLVRVLSALRDLKGARQCGSSALQIAEYICANYEHDGDVLSQVQTALKRALRNEMVKLNRNKNYTCSEPVSRNKGTGKHRTFKIKKLRTRKCRIMQMRKIKMKNMKKAKREQISRMNKASKTNTSENKRSNNGKLVKCPERSKFVLLDWLKLKLIKFRCKWSFQ